MSALKKWLDKLTIRVSVLRYSCKFNKVEKSESELARCQSLLEQIYHHAQLQQASIAPFFLEINMLQDAMEEVKKMLEKKKNPFWARFRKQFVSALGVVFKIVGLAQMTGFLFDNDGPDLLT